MCNASGIPGIDRIRNAVKDPKFDTDFGSKGCNIKIQLNFLVSKMMNFIRKGLVYISFGSRILQ